MSFTITDKRVGLEFKRSSLEQAKQLAFVRVLLMVHDNLQLGREMRRIFNWKGKGVITVRYGNDFVSIME